MDELTALTQKSMNSLQSNSESETPEQTKARGRFVMQLFARFEAASGRRIDEDGTDTRRLALINELNLRRYSEQEAKIAQEWILRGNPVRFGSLTLADFFPGPDELSSVGFSLATELRKAERAGVDKGYHMGYSEARQAIQPKQQPQGREILIPLTDAERMDYERLKGKCEALEESVAALRKQIIQLERRRDRKPSEIFNAPSEQHA